MSAPENAVDVLAVLDAFAAQNAMVCCGMHVGGGMDENGNGDPPTCCNYPFTSYDLHTARAAVADLIEAANEFYKAQNNLDNHELAGINADPYENLMRRRNRARIGLEDALARCGGAK